MDKVIPLFADKDRERIEDNAEAIRLLCDDVCDLLAIPPEELATLILDLDGKHYTAFEVISRAAHELWALAGLIDERMQK